MRKETGEFLLSLLIGINTIKSLINTKKKEIVLEETIKSEIKPKNELRITKQQTLIRIFKEFLGITKTLQCIGVN